jgi:putative ABC transport system permease protein
MLRVTPVMGRSFTSEEDRPHAPKVGVISYRLWKERFRSDPAVVDKTINLDGSEVRVVGVLPADFEMPTLEEADVVVPAALDETEQRHLDPGHVFYPFARLKPGITIEQAIQRMQPLFEGALAQAPPQFRKEIHLRVRSLRDRQMHDVRSIAWILLGVVLTMLLIACANVTGLLIARASVREREFAVRAALGASRARLVQQAWIESMTLAGFAALIGIAFAYILLRVFIAIAPEGMPFLANTHLDHRILAFALVIAFVCGGACGLVAALHKPRAEALAGRTSMAAPHARLRQLLVIAQIAASMMLLAGGALLFRSFRNLEEQRLGIRTEHLISASVVLGQKNYPDGQNQMAFFQRLQAQVKNGPGVRMFAMSDSLPPGGWHHEHIRAAILVNGVRFTDGTGGLVAWRWATPDYFRIMGIPLLRGSGFTAEQQDSTEHFIVLSQSLAERLFPGQDPIGQHMQVAGGSPQDPQYTVVGVVGDAKNGGLAGVDEPEYYRLRRNRAEDWNASSILIFNTSLPVETMGTWARSQVAAVDPTVPVEIETISDRVRKLADRPLFETALVGFFAFTGLLMAMVGLYGVLAFLAARRTQEIGLRMALGATRSDILQLMLKSGLGMVLPGIGMGVLAGVAASRVLVSMLFNVGPHDPATFGIASLVLLSIAVVATLVPAVRSARLNPMNALREE